MADAFKRVKVGTVTDALIAATEQADEMDHVLIVFQGKGDHPGGMVCDENLDVKTALYITKQLEHWMFRHVKEFE